MTNPIHTNNSVQKYEVILESLNDDGYSARLLAWPDAIVQAPTRERALQQIRRVLLQRLASSEIVTLEIQPSELDHSWVPFAGMWADNPDLAEFQAEIERNRRELDAIHAPWMLEEENSSETQPKREFTYCNSNNNAFVLVHATCASPLSP